MSMVHDSGDMKRRQGLRKKKRKRNNVGRWLYDSLGWMARKSGFIRTKEESKQAQ